MATRGGKARGRKAKKTAAKKDVVPHNEEQKVLLSFDDIDEAQIKEAEETIERLRRKYKHKIEEVKVQEATNDCFTTISPSKRKQNDTAIEENDEIIQCVTNEVTNDMNDSSVQSYSSEHDKENFVTSNTKPEYTIMNNKGGKPLDERRSLSRQPSLEPSSLTTPENQYNPFVYNKQPKKRLSNFRYSKLDNSNSLPPSPATVNSLAFPSPSQSPQDQPAVVINKKAVKALSFDSVHNNNDDDDDDDNESVNEEQAAGAKKGAKKKSLRKLKKESQEIDEWAEAIKREFQEVDQFQLVID